jgi:hypothetical protein
VSTFAGGPRPLVSWRRVAYDIPRAQARIRAIPELAPQMADRLALGV